MASATPPRTIPALLRGAADHASQPAVIAYTADAPVVIERHRLQAMAHAHARVLRDAGLGRGDRVLIQAPNSIEWIVVALATLIHGGVLVPVDAQMGHDDLVHVIADAEPARIYITRTLRAALPPPPDAVPIIEIDTMPLDEAADDDAAPPDAPGADDTATVFYTSGTTGPPKGVPLTHANLVSNVQALLEERIAGSDDRVLLPLPLHHVYPFSVGLLTVLGVGATLILPRSLVGPRIAEALRAGQATILLGVPRLYEALWSRLEERLGGQQRWRQRLFHAAVAFSERLQSRLGWPVGRWLFRPVMKRLAPSLRLAVNGGAALDPAIAAVVAQPVAAQALVALTGPDIAGEFIDRRLSRRLRPIGGDVDALGVAGTGFGISGHRLEQGGAAERPAPFAGTGIVGPGKGCCQSNANEGDWLVSRHGIACPCRWWKRFCNRRVPYTLAWIHR